jgi:5'-methylthioinosine phosphorylase
MKKFAIIGGSGLDTLGPLQVSTRRLPMTAWGAPSGPLCEGSFAGSPVIFLPRHGESHRIPPHLINYRANIAALKDAGVSAVIAVAAVGGIGPEAGPGRIVVPDQLIDYTWGREHSFADGSAESVLHVDFTEPYTGWLRQLLIEAAPEADVDVVDRGVYGATQGPRLETAAEITRMARDGCTLIGMTGMPEAALAREAGLDYACVALSVNWAAGLGGNAISLEEIGDNLARGMNAVLRLVGRAIADALSG